jgi:RNA recognition motif-containing protein
VYVGNIPRSSTEAEMRALYSQYGRIVDLVLPRRIPVAFVEYATHAEATAAIRETNGRTFWFVYLLLLVPEPARLRIQCCLFCACAGSLA